MEQLVILAVARTDHEDTLLRPEISVHSSISEAQGHFLTHHIPVINKIMDEGEDEITSLDDDRIIVQNNLTGTTTIDLDLNSIQVCATIKVHLF